MTVWLLEDEPAAARQLQDFLRLHCTYADDVRWFRSLNEAGTQGAAAVPDALIADIQLEEESGIDGAEALSRQFPGLKVIFLTANPALAQDVFASLPQVAAVLFKDMGWEERLKRYLGKLYAELDSRNARLRLDITATPLDLPLRGIRYIAHDRNDTMIHRVSGESVRLRVKLEDLLPRLDGRFLRCGKSFIVNLGYVDGVDGPQWNYFRLGFETVPISRAYKAAAQEAFHEWKGGLARG